MHSPCDILVVGRLYCDLVFAGLDRLPSLGREEYAQGLVVTAGGGAFITAAQLKALGRAPGLVGRVGEDPFGHVVVREIARAGLERRWIATQTGPAPQVTVAMPVAGERAFLTKLAGSGALDHAQAAIAQCGARHLHIAELATLAAMPDLPAAARAAGMQVSLDCSWDAEVIADPEARRLIGLVDLFLPNAAEACALTDLPEGETLAALERLACRVPAVAVKCGANGGLARDGTGTVSVAAPPVEAVDTTGAGDAFNAGFLDRLLAGAGLEECLRWAVAAGSQAVQDTGGAVTVLDTAAVRRTAETGRHHHAIGSGGHAA